MLLNDFLHDLKYADLPEEVVRFAKRCLLDLIGVAAGGTATDLSRMIRSHAYEQFSAGPKRASMLFDGRTVSPVGAAMANGMTIDSLDAHDGHKLTKGHVGCGIFPALLAYSQAEGKIDAKEFLTALVLGYEIGTRAGIALHRTACDYHTSGAWIAVACAALGARTLQLDSAATREAIGIAEYHGPRSQMMRCIDHPTMVKDGSGWGAMAGVSAAYLAARGFTGAPAVTVESDAVRDIWEDLGKEWRILEQYFKLYPVCRWAQPAVEAVAALQRTHRIQADDIDVVEIETFHQARRLHTTRPATTEAAQYSLPFPTAAFLVHGRLGPSEISGAALHDPQVLRLAESMTLSESEAYNAAFPKRRFAHAAIRMKDGRKYVSQTTEAQGDPEAHVSDAVIRSKFRDTAEPVLGTARCRSIEAAIEGLSDLSLLAELIVAPPLAPQ